MPDPKQVVVIGGGISGLVCAYRLKQLGVPVTLLEASSRAGGVVATVEKDGFLFERGPQSFQGTDAMLGLIGELGIDEELQRADPKAPRFIYVRGKLQKVPMTPQALLASSFLGVNSRFKIASEPFLRSKPPATDESVADFVRRKFGHEILEYLVAPFVSGVYAGDPEKLSLKAAFPTLEEWEREYGSVLRGAMKSRSASEKRAGPPGAVLVCARSWNARERAGFEAWRGLSAWRSSEVDQPPFQLRDFVFARRKQRIGLFGCRCDCCAGICSSASRRFTGFAPGAHAVRSRLRAGRGCRLRLLRPPDRWRSRWIRIPHPPR